MAANALESSSDDISFSEWHFVPKSWTSEQYSDDDSIEIIEREVLRISTPSSSDNEDDEAESGNEVEEDESKVPGDLALVVAIPSNQDLEVPSNETFTENVQTIDTVDQCRCMIMENDPTNEALNITRTMFYSFIVALLAVIVVHINRDYLIDSLFRNVYREQENLDLDEETCPINARSKYEYMELQKEVNTLKKTFVDIVNESDDIAEILYPTIVGSVNEIKYLGKEVYYVDLKYRPIKYEPLHPDYVDPMNRIRFRLLRALKDIAVDCPNDEEVNVVGFQLPLLCKRPEKLCLFISRPQYKDIFNNIITSLEKDVDKMCDLFPDYCRRNLKEPKDDSREPLWKTGNPRFDDEHDPQFKGLQTLNRVSNTLNFVDAVQPEENAPTESKNEEDYEDENNLEKGASSDEEYEVVDRLDMSRGMSVLNMVETKINQLKKEINKSMKRFNKKYKKMFGKQFWKDFMCKEDCPEKAQDSEKIEDDSLSDKNNNKSDAHAEWITKRAEAREKRRKEHDEKLGKKCSEKNFDGWNSDMPHCKKEFEQEFKDGFKFYPNKFDYRAWIKRTRDKVKSEYKIFASKLKSKFKTLSNWKHYAKSMFQRFHF